MKILYKFTSLNEYIRAERTNKYIASQIKKTETNVVHMNLLNKPKLNTPCRLKFTWLIKNKRKDLDNIAFAKKYVLDGMVKAGIIPDDTLKHIIGFQDEFIVCKEDGVIVEVIE